MIDNYAFYKVQIYFSIIFKDTGVGGCRLVLLVAIVIKG